MITVMVSETFGQRLKRLREQCGYSKYRLAKESSINESYIYQLEGDVAANPRQDTLKALAEPLGISVSELAGEDHRSLVDIFQDAQRRLDELEVVEIPIYGSVPAGEPDAREQTIEGHIIVCKGDLGVETDKLYALRVDGNSLVGDGIQSDDYVIVKPDDQVAPGKIHVLRCEEGVFIRHVRRGDNDTYRLESSNPEYSPVEAHNCRCCGQVILSGRWRKQ